MGAEAMAKELPRLGLADALELTILIARKAPRRHPRVAARWLLRYMEEDDEVTIDELVLAERTVLDIPSQTLVELPWISSASRCSRTWRP
jgi:hypothetical protein